MLIETGVKLMKLFQKFNVLGLTQKFKMSSFFLYLLVVLCVTQPEKGEWATHSGLPVFVKKLCHFLSWGAIFLKTFFEKYIATKHVVKKRSKMAPICVTWQYWC